MTTSADACEATHEPDTNRISNLQQARHANPKIDMQRRIYYRESPELNKRLEGRLSFTEPIKLLTYTVPGGKYDQCEQYLALATGTTTKLVTACL
jgi:hypothetical protein